MPSDTQPSNVSKKALWAGYVASALPVLMLALSASMKLLLPPAAVEGNKHLGWDDKLALPLAIVEISCAIVYLIPRTAVLGAVLLTGYLGGAVAAHVRVGDPFLIPIVLGVLIWGGLCLRDPRVRALLPLRG